MSDIEKQIDELEEKYIEEFDEVRMKKDINDDDKKFDSETMELRAELRAFMKAVKSYQTIMETQGRQIQNLSDIVDEIKRDKTNPSDALTELNIKYMGLDKKIDEKFDEMKKMLCPGDVRDFCHGKFDREGKLRKWLSKYGGYALTTIIGAITMAIWLWLKEWFSKIGGGSP